MKVNVTQIRRISTMASQALAAMIEPQRLLGEQMPDLPTTNVI